MWNIEIEDIFDRVLHKTGYMNKIKGDKHHDHYSPNFHKARVRYSVSPNSEKHGPHHKETYVKQ